MLQAILSTSLLELIAGGGYLGGHFLLSKNKGIGWLLKVIGGIAWIVFLYQNNNHIFMAVTIVVVMAMFYGFYKWQKEERESNKPKMWLKLILTSRREREREN